MHAHFIVQLNAVHWDHNHDGVLGRVSRNVSATLDWLAGPAMTEQERRDQTIADVHNRRFEETVI